MAALNIAARLLKVGSGTFVAKIFRGRDIGLLYKQFKQHFCEVYCAKPRSCRNSSIEAFLVAKGFKGIILEKELNNGALLNELNHLANYKDVYFDRTEETDDKIVPFVACGNTDESFDPDMNYSLLQDTSEASVHLISQTDYKYVPPRQEPINPPYKEFIDLKKNI